MDALGMIETKGLLAAIESSDAMLKAAEVRLLERTFVGGGLVTITIVGDVAAVKASVDAAAAAVTRLGSELLVSQHVIPRPHEELSENIVSPTPISDLKHPAKPEEEAPKIPAEPEEAVKADILAEPNETEISEAEIQKAEQPAEELPNDVAEMHKADMDRLVAKVGAEAALETISKCKVVKLRNLAREYEDFGIAGRLISKANKSELLEEFRKYYR